MNCSSANVATTSGCAARKASPQRDVPVDITLSELALETFFPAIARRERRCAALPQ